MRWKFPILLFGIFFIMAMPFLYFLIPNLIFLTIATILGVIGSSAVGVTNSMLAIELVRHDLRQAYFSITNLLALPFLIITTPVFAYLAQVYGLGTLFLVLALILALTIIVLSCASIFLKKEIV